MDEKPQKNKQRKENKIEYYFEVKMRAELQTSEYVRHFLRLLSMSVTLSKNPDEIN